MLYNYNTHPHPFIRWFLLWNPVYSFWYISQQSLRWIIWLDQQIISINEVIYLCIIFFNSLEIVVVKDSLLYEFQTIIHFMMEELKRWVQFLDINSGGSTGGLRGCNTQVHESDNGSNTEPIGIRRNPTKPNKKIRP
jgi:hypothetical protein